MILRRLTKWQPAVITSTCAYNTNASKFVTDYLVDKSKVGSLGVATFLLQYLCLPGTLLAHSSSYHPQSYGKIDIVKKCLEGYLRCFVSDKQTQWVKWLPLAEWWYNTSFHTAWKMTPFMELWYHPPSITSYLRENSKVQAMEDHIEHQQQVP